MYQSRPDDGSKAVAHEKLDSFLRDNDIIIWTGWNGETSKLATHSMLEIDVGWYDLVIKMFKDMINSRWDKTIIQVKQKFGELRVYIPASNPMISDVINEYEMLSKTTCENCGSPNAKTITIRYYITTICEACNVQDK